MNKENIAEATHRRPTANPVLASLGFTGLGFHDLIIKAYRKNLEHTSPIATLHLNWPIGFLVENWSDGDEIVIIGYSRGD